jgi:hypothetical protein
VEKSRRALHVREQESDCARRKITRHGRKARLWSPCHRIGACLH